MPLSRRRKLLRSRLVRLVLALSKGDTNHSSDIAAAAVEADETFCDRLVDACRGATKTAQRALLRHECTEVLCELIRRAHAFGREARLRALAVRLSCLVLSRQLDNLKKLRHDALFCKEQLEQALRYLVADVISRKTVESVPQLVHMAVLECLGELPELLVADPKKPFYEDTEKRLCVAPPLENITLYFQACLRHPSVMLARLVWRGLLACVCKESAPRQSIYKLASSLLDSSTSTAVQCLCALEFLPTLLDFGVRPLETEIGILARVLQKPRFASGMNLPVGRKAVSMLILACPQSISPSKNSLTTVTLELPAEYFPDVADVARLFITRRNFELAISILPFIWILKQDARTLCHLSSSLLEIFSGTAPGAAAARSRIISSLIRAIFFDSPRLSQKFADNSIFESALSSGTVVDLAKFILKKVASDVEAPWEFSRLAEIFFIFQDDTDRIRFDEILALFLMRSVTLRNERDAMEALRSFEIIKNGGFSLKSTKEAVCDVAIPVWSSKTSDACFNDDLLDFAKSLACEDSKDEYSAASCSSNLKPRKLNLENTETISKPKEKTRKKANSCIEENQGLQESLEDMLNAADYYERLQRLTDSEQGSRHACNHECYD